ncbi:hypothetical protein GALMADRAFT_362969 [Galerina marginata CBS 339.88]|uniref:Vta1/callose synthase N-terminal domain-containing protein n=1 Tax=Galerina marginata (strain CBS 339.88) TaxID=685588 RepID=A0A067TT57_GALM3|nr:hypothetical protein GALMADRAFT_362969 [Galerina marginata CBS 339.88]
MSSSILGLPPVPPELKAVTPYLQRAEELKNQDPIVSYWCAYYAAQVGISLKARSAAARDLLLALLGALEHMKSDIGASDAIDIESVSSAYVENFALKVFANADNEDRSGRATRSTAKKFLAAANFLEILKTFPKTDISESNEDKIRYAKWKAADIAKAYREGRKPIPGPPGWAEEQEELKRQLSEEGPLIPSPPNQFPDFSLPPHTIVTSSSPTRSTHMPSSSPTKHSPTSSSPTKMDHHLGVDRANMGWSDAPPESWSTAATPGTEEPGMYAIGTPSPSTAGYEQEHYSPPRVGTEIRTTKPRSGSGSSSNTVSSNGGKNRTPSSSPPKSALKSGSPDSDKKVHFSPSTVGSPPPHQPQLGSPKEYLGPSSIYAPPQAPISPPAVIHPSHPPIPPYTSVTSPSLQPSISPPKNYIYAPNPPSLGSPTRSTGRYPYPSAPPPAPPPIELTPGLIGKAQKHCRFAISALDYEDAEQAKKELRAALALLGG